MALYLPVLLFVVFAVVQASLLYLGNQAASAAAREAARAARSGGGSVQARLDGERRGREYAATVGRGVLTEVRVSVRLVSGPGGPTEIDQVRAVVTGRGVHVLPGLPLPGIRQVSQGPLETFRPDA